MAGIRGAALILDDSRAHAALAAELRAAGFVTIEASEPAGASEYLRNLRFDLIIVDCGEDAPATGRFLDEVAQNQPGAICLATNSKSAECCGLPFLCVGGAGRG